MWVEAVLATEDIVALLAETLPLTIRLGDDGELFLKDPRDVRLVADDGIHAWCEARLRWTVLGVRVPVTLHSLKVIIRPFVDPRPEGPTLIFTLEIEHVDVKFLPDAIDDEVTARINAELAKKHVDLEWNFGDTLSHVFKMPRALEEIDSLAVVVRWGRARVTEQALVLAVSFQPVVGRSDNAHGAVAPLAAPPAPASALTHVKPPAVATAAAAAGPSYGALAGAVAIAAALGFLMSRALSPRRSALAAWLGG